MPQNNKYRNQDAYSWETFRHRLKKLMDSHGMTGKDFADEVGLAPSTVTRYLTERVPDTPALWRIGDYWGVSLDWLLGRDDMQQITVSDEAKRVAAAYAAASAEDKKVVEMILSKYE